MVEGSINKMNGAPDADIAVFTEALRLPPEERDRYLSEACKGDGAFRRRVEVLLQAYEQAGDFLGKPAADRPARAAQALAAGEKPGDRIGHYKLLQQIGEGGCGVVYMAQQEAPIRRRVALKIIKPGMDTKNVIARFEAERQALALMDHQSICHVFDAGATESGRPYFVMELVKGVKITDYCDRHSLSIDARLELFIQVCDAIQHAHQKGIIHRDIKPSNIMVTTGRDGKPAPKIIDFGIAKAITGHQLTDKTIFTAYEMLIGTPAYMSPEQAALAITDVDTRTDIYSLGVLLYELLTGTTPFDTRELLKAGFDEVRRVIRDQEPVRPSTRLTTMTAADLVGVSKHHGAEGTKLIREMRGELDWIVMKALEKDRTRRYATANGFAMDISRYLSGEAILARPPSTWYQFRKLAERNRLLFGALSMVATALVIGFVAVTIALTREQAARREAVKARRDAETDKTRSEEVTHFLREVLNGAAPSTALTQDTTVLREILDKTAKRLAVELTNQPAVQADLRAELGKVYADIGRNAQAEAMFREALTNRIRLSGAESEAASDVMYELGEVLNEQYKTDEAESCVRRALAVRQKLFGERNLKVAECYTTLGSTFWRRHQFPRAEEMLQKSLAIHRQLDGDDSPRLGDALLGLGAVLYSQGKHLDAEDLFRQAMTNYEKGLDADHPSVILSAKNLAAALTAQGKDQEAERLLRRVLATRRKLFSEEHPGVADTLDMLTHVLFKLQRFDEAEVTAREDFAVARKIWGDTSEAALEAFRDLIDALLSQLKFEEAERLFADVLPPERELLPEYANLLFERCNTRARCGQWRKAAEDAAILLKHSPDSHEYYHTLAPLHVRLGDLVEYQELCRTILDKFSRTTDIYIADRMAKDCLILPSSGVDLKTVAAMADLAASRGSKEGAAPYFHFCKGLAEFRLGHYDEAMKWASLAAKGSFPQPKACALAVLAMSQFKLDQSDDARTALSECNKIIEEQMPKPERDLGRAWRDWIIARALQSEAKQLIDGEPSVARPANLPES
jgi:eukaryotic-like serine/threonine-protein kinase